MTVACNLHDDCTGQSHRPSPEGAEPRTEAGRAMADYLDGFDSPEEVKVRILAIEREAALPEPPLDVSLGRGEGWHLEGCAGPHEVGTDCWCPLDLDKVGLQLWNALLGCDDRVPVQGWSQQHVTDHLRQAINVARRLRGTGGAP